jgi:hypothetical protein
MSSATVIAAILALDYWANPIGFWAGLGLR